NVSAPKGKGRPLRSGLVVRGGTSSLVGGHIVGVDPAAAGDLHPLALRADGREGLAGRQAADLAVVGARARADAQVGRGAVVAAAGVLTGPLLVAADVGAGRSAGGGAGHGAQGALIVRNLAAGDAADEGADDGARALAAARGVAVGDAVGLLGCGGGRQRHRGQTAQQGGGGDGGGDLVARHGSSPVIELV